jgi:hypothetical protein
MKTAVEFLLEKYKSQNTLLFAEDFEQAKEMEEDQLLTTWWEPKDKSFQDYYNQTFKK